MSSSNRNFSNEQMEKAYRLKTIKMKREINKFKTLSLILMVVSVVSILICGFCVTKFASQAVKINELKGNNTYLSLSYTELSDAYTELYDTYEGMYDLYVDMIDYTEECQDNIVLLSDYLSQMEYENDLLVDANEEYWALIQEYETRSELYDKYEYAITRTNGTRTDITYDQLTTLETICADENVDMDLVLSIVMVESSGVETASNSESSARGYGQLIYSTAEFVYEDLLELGTYYHSYAYDGDTNLAMVVAYLDYLDEYYDGDTYSVLENYRGMSGSVLSSYIDKIDNYLSNSNKSVGLLASTN